MDKHKLTLLDEDPKGYGDGLDDEWHCSCGASFGVRDIEDAFDHGRDITQPAVILVEVVGGIQTTTQLRGPGAAVIEIDWDNLEPDAGNDRARAEAEDILDEIERLGVGSINKRHHVGMPEIVRQLREVVEASRDGAVL